MKTLKTLFALIAMLFCCTSIFADVVVDYDFKVDGICYGITSETGKTVKVTYNDHDNYNSIYNRYTKYEGSIIIPETVTYNGSTYSVTSIGNYAFYNCPSLTSIEIPSSVTSVGYWALRDCSSLTSIKVDSGNSVYDSRGNCNAIIKTSTNELVAGCLSTIIPNNVTSIANSAFYGCSGLESIEIPNSVTDMGLCVFQGCSSLKYVKMSSNLNSIPLRTFRDCINLTTFSIPNSIVEIEGEAFYNCKSLKAITIPDNVKIIGQGAFLYCEKLTSMFIPKNVTSIGDFVFGGCCELTSLIVESSNSVYDSRNNCNAIIKTSTNTLISGTQSTYIPENVKRIGTGAFWHCKNLTSIKFPSEMTCIESQAFVKCSKLRSLFIPKRLTMIDSPGVTFSGCNDIKSIIVEEGNSKYDSRDDCNAIVETVSNSLIVGCQNTIIPSNIESIGRSAFSGQTEIKEIVIPEKVKIIEGCAFEYCSPNSIQLPSELKNIGAYAFGKNLDLRNVFCSAKTPPATDRVAFYESSIDDAILYVPKEYLEKYKVTYPWNLFGNIKELPNFSISYLIDGVEYYTDSLTYGEHVTTPSYPFKDGYTFSGWENMPETMPAEDVVVNGSFNINLYTIKYIIDNKVVLTDTVEYGSEIILVNAPEKEGYSFNWSSTPITMPAYDIVVVGSYKVNSYAVKYVVDGVAYATDSLIYGSAITLRDEPVKEGHTFLGWSEAPETMPANDITITGEWSINSYLVTYIVDGEVYATDSVEYGAAITLPEVPEKENSTFEWEEAPETMPASDLTIYGNYVSGIGGVTVSGKADVYTLNGMLYKRDVDLNNLSIELPKGVYIINGKKIMVK